MSPTHCTRRAFKSPQGVHESGDGQCPMSGIHSHGCCGSEPTRKTDSQKVMLNKPNSSGFSRVKIMKSTQSSVELCYL